MSAQAGPAGANGSAAEAVQLFKRIAALGPPDVPDESAAESLAALRDKFESATAALLEGRVLGRDGSPVRVQDLPWYVVVGAPGAGNSTVLTNSGLNFPLEAEESRPQLTGVGGTRYCEWWFSDEAVFVDTAGRYVAHESRNLKDALAGSAAWHAFLRLVKETRRSRPINGAIVTVSITDLLLWTKAERQQFAAHVRMRLSELYAGLDSRFPVYLVFTKMDLLAGFAEMFGGLDDEACTQVWGTTFDAGADPVDIARGYSTDFAMLQERLYAEMLDRLQKEPDLARRAAIYRFPQQFHAIGPMVQELLGMAFATHIDHRPTMLRGAYFVSATQAGKPIDRVMRTLERAFKVAHREVEATGPTRSYFVTRLLREVIFREASLAMDGMARRGAHGRSPAFVAR